MVLVGRTATTNSYEAAENDLRSRSPRSFLIRCDFRCCHSCRPSYRDRAFQSLNTLLAMPLHSTPPWELENLRISDARVLAEFFPLLSDSYIVRGYGSHEDGLGMTSAQNIRGGRGYKKYVRLATGKARGVRSILRNRTRKTLRDIGLS